jgi:uncharacterized protein (TIGR02001 family)
MNRKAIGVIASVCMGFGALFAGPVAAEETSDWDFSGNVAITNDYMYRGFTQTGGDFAIQGGFDVAHSSGFYVGTWASNIDFGDSANIEMDFYGGYAGEFGNSMFSYDVGVIYYAYPGDPKGSKYDFVEFGATLGADFGPAALSVGAWFSPNFFGGIGDSIYVPIGLEVPIPVGDGPVGLAASGTVAFNHFFDAGGNYINWDLGLTVSVEDLFDIDLRYHDTDIPDVLCKGVCDARFAATISRSF